MHCSDVQRLGPQCEIRQTQDDVSHVHYHICKNTTETITAPTIADAQLHLVDTQATSTTDATRNR